MLGYVKMSLAPRRSKRKRKSSENTEKNKKPRLAEAVLSRTPDEEPIDIFAPKDADWSQWVSATQNLGLTQDSGVKESPFELTLPHNTHSYILLTPSIRLLLG